MVGGRILIRGRKTDVGLTDVSIAWVNCVLRVKVAVPTLASVMGFGFAVTEYWPVVKVHVVLSEIPAKRFPAKSLNAPASTCT